MRVSPIIEISPVRPHGPDEIQIGAEVSMSGAEAISLFARFKLWFKRIITCRKA